MNILVIGEKNNLVECERKFGNSHQFTLTSEHRDAEKLVTSYDMVFDFIIDEEPYEFEIYLHKEKTVFLNTAKVSISQLTHPFKGYDKGRFFGFNGLPTFLTMPMLEVSVFNPKDKPHLDEICKHLKTEYTIVDDRVGLVTPRIICMIINEAYYTVQEKTATEADIDLAMKLGTNYPHGPFEWSRHIGIRHVYELLEAVYDDTKDERYKICPLLRKQYLLTKEN
jgi:3-hydroxybutyryl-CoA dehydrogenase